MSARARLLVAGLIAAFASANAGAQDAAAPRAWSRTAVGDESAATPAERGAAVFNNWCGACHSRDTRNAPGTTSLEHKYRGAVPAALEDRTDLTADAIETFVRNGVATMPFFRKTEIDDAALADLVAYLTRR